MGASREDLIKGLWPDKILYGSVMLIVTGLAGALLGAVLSIAAVQYSPNVPAFLRTYPPFATVVLSLATTGLGYLALQQRNTNYAIVGALAGIAALGLFGIGAVFSLIALGFVALSRLEREDVKAATVHLGDEMWPDKSLAASLLLFMNGLVTLVWGLALLGRLVSFTLADATVFGAFAVLVGAASLASARLLYHQQGPTLGLLCAVASLFALGMYIIGPFLSLGALYYLNLAQREREFHKPRAAEKPTAAPPPR
ncbi:MAG TPA: hypothetical protein VGR28_10150 [Candidatus Thermoplasmatota archaeon]|jgi:hypothetical protein|nr:hypothetical protein [Candidatus Thermoplasmatota archaeon]